MLRSGQDVPYKSSGVTMIWKENGEYFFDNSITGKREILEKKPKDILCVWSGEWKTDAFEIDWYEFQEAFDDFSCRAKHDSLRAKKKEIRRQMEVAIEAKDQQKLEELTEKFNQLIMKN